jgi:hypothetical protein
MENGYGMKMNTKEGNGKKWNTGEMNEKEKK